MTRPSGRPLVTTNGASPPVSIRTVIDQQRRRLIRCNIKNILVGFFGNKGTAVDLRIVIEMDHIRISLPCGKRTAGDLCKTAIRQINCACYIDVVHGQCT